MKRKHKAIVDQIVSGGQTGVDRAALDAALQLKFACGGWCPRGRKAEDGSIDASYPLEETPSRSYVQRTRWNVRDSDGTLVLTYGPATGGTALTLQIADELDQPSMMVDIASPLVVSQATAVQRWLHAQHIRILNVAGPRGSHHPDVHKRALSFVKTILQMPALPRKGARNRDSIPPAVLRQLNKGEIETSNLVEGLAMDFIKLVRSCHFPAKFSDIKTQLASDVGYTTRMARVGEWIFNELDEDGIQTCRNHPSDTVRGWAAYAIGAMPKMSLRSRLKLIRPLANDAHFAVREWAWIAVREHLSQNVTLSLKTLIPWARDASENIRRFAIESIRPRGVWCAHLPEFKEHPEQAEPILEHVRSDASKYVQDSVANWLNDASKTAPEWVEELCQRWEEESPTAATTRICRRARRSMKPKK